MRIQYYHSTILVRLRVAFLTPTLLMGGAERWMISLARCCDPRRIEWTGTALTEGALTSPELCREMAAYMPIYAGPWGESPFIARRPSAREALDSALSGADALITWGIENLPELIGAPRPRVIFVSHGGGQNASRAIQNSESGATHFVAVSEPARRLFSPDVRDRTTILHNGIDVPRCTPTRTREQTRSLWGMSEHHRLIGYVGRYSSEKNPLAAARAVANLGEDYRAVYAGEGWMETELRRDVESIAGHRALFIPTDRQVGDVLSALDAFVLASPAEGFSLSMAEAWYCGVPVVATRVGAVRELEQRFGPLVSPVPVHPSPGALAAAVEDALSPEFRRDVVPRAQAMVCRHFTAAAMAGRWMNYLESICETALA